MGSSWGIRILICIECVYISLRDNTCLMGVKADDKTSEGERAGEPKMADTCFPAALGGCF